MSRLKQPPFRDVMAPSPIEALARSFTGEIPTITDDVHAARLRAEMGVKILDSLTRDFTENMPSQAALDASPRLGEIYDIDKIKPERDRIEWFVGQFREADFE